MTSFDDKREISIILSRQDRDGGFPEIPGGDYRPDATAWVILCLDAYQLHSQTVAAARTRLRATQKTDGSIPLSVDHPGAFWTTFPCVLALSGAPEHKVSHAKAIDFLLSAIGRHNPKQKNDPTGHDTMIQGWPWIEQTHSWVEPTSMAVRALSEAGLTNHNRTQEGVKLLLDRQLKDGGWNYGNTTLYGQHLNPMPVSTGIALWALADHVERSQITGSIKYLQEQLDRLKTPLSLGWALKGLSSWDVKIKESQKLAINSLERQRRYGFYNTSQIAILLLAMTMLGIQESANV